MSEKNAKAARKAEVIELEDRKKDQKKEIDTQAAKQTLEKDRQERVGKCNRIIALALKKYNCRLEAIMVISRVGNMPEIKILSN